MEKHFSLKLFQLWEPFSQSKSLGPQFEEGSNFAALEMTYKNLAHLWLCSSMINCLFTLQPFLKGCMLDYVEQRWQAGLILRPQPTFTWTYGHTLILFGHTWIIEFHLWTSHRKRTPTIVKGGWGETGLIFFSRTSVESLLRHVNKPEVQKDIIPA